MMSSPNGTISSNVALNRRKTTEVIIYTLLKNVPSVEIPVVEYNGERYCLHQVYDEIYESEPLVVNK